MRNWLNLAVAVAVAALLATVIAHFGGNPGAKPADVSDTAAAHPSTTPSSRPIARGRESFVGSAACAVCHRAQSDAYLGSHHAKALVAPSAEMAKARFDGG